MGIVRRIAIGVGLLVALAALVALGASLWLVFPTRPASAPGIRFVGFVHLPKDGKGALSILDYLTVDGRDLFVTSESAGSVYRVPLSSGPLPATGAIATLPGAGASHGVVIDPTSRLAFASHSNSNTVDVFNPATLSLIKRIPVPPDVDGIFFEPNARLVYAVSGDPKVATLIDPQTQAKVGVIPLGGKPEFAVYDPLTKLIYQNLADKDVIAVVDVAKRAVVETWSLGACKGPTSIVLDDAHRRLFVVCAVSSNLVVLDPATHAVVATLPVGGAPDSVAYDPASGRLYTAGKAGTTTVVQQTGADGYRVVANIKLHYGAHTLAIDPVAHRLYVGYASVLIAPRLAVFDIGR